jgi:hypothetical protein
MAQKSWGEALTEMLQMACTWHIFLGGHTIEGEGFGASEPVVAHMAFISPYGISLWSSISCYKKN